MRKFNLEYIKGRRLMLGLTHQEMADALSFKNGSTYYKYEVGDFLFRAIHLPPMAEILKCDINSFFTPYESPVKIDYGDVKGKVFSF